MVADGLNNATAFTFWLLLSFRRIRYLRLIGIWLPTMNRSLVLSLAGRCGRHRMRDVLTALFHRHKGHPFGAFVALGPNEPEGQTPRVVTGSRVMPRRPDPE
jgi:hypothetical protein